MYDDLVELVKEYCEESKLTYDPNAVHKYLSWILKDSYLLVHKNEEGKIVGALSFVVAPHHMTGKTIGRKIAWFVKKEYRGKIGRELLKQAEDKARELGATKFFCSTPTKMVTDYFPVETEYEKVL
jgi:N-acetylglutamate synthase-like GNAT family acetyltransferase